MTPSPPLSPQPQHHILFLDAHDSFSNNITALLASILSGTTVSVLSIDSPLLPSTSAPYFKRALRKELARYTAVVCGPGPGNPHVEDDVGIMRGVWEVGAEVESGHGNADDEGWSGPVPVLGICLGFQSLIASSRGGKVRRLRRGLHGMVREVQHRQEDVFDGVGRFKATLYHSLCADIGQDTLSDHPNAASGTFGEEWWQPTSQCPDIVPLAWVDEPRDDIKGGGSERILMAARHKTKPFWGLQYHPESVCSEEAGHNVIVNWFQEALAWNERMGRKVEPFQGELAHSATRPSLLSMPITLSTPTPRNGLNGMNGRNGINGTDGTNGIHPTGEQQTWQNHALNARYHSRRFSLPHPKFTAVDAIEALGTDPKKGSDHIILDSANAALPPPAAGAVDVRGRYSIIAIDVADCLRFEHAAGTRTVTIHLPQQSGSSRQKTEKVRFSDGEDAEHGVWRLLAEFREARRVSMGDKDDNDRPPFLGGFMGYVTYEQGLHDIGVGIDPAERKHERPDVCLAWVTRSVVLDHVKGVAHVQCSAEEKTEADSWIWKIMKCLGSSSAHRNGINDAQTPRSDVQVNVQKPDSSKYEAKVRLCQEFIAAGESYELCLTDQTDITLSSSSARPPNATTKATPSLTNGHLQHNTNGHHPINSTNQTQHPTPLPTPWSLYTTLRLAQPAPFASYIRLGGATLLSSSPERFLRCEGPEGLLCKMKPMKGTVRKNTSPQGTNNDPSAGVRTLAEASALLRVPKEEAENLMIVDLVRHDLHSVCGPGNVSVPQLLDVEEYASVFQMVTVVEGRLPSPSFSSKTQHRYTGLDVLAASLPPGSMTGAPKRRSCEILKQIEGGRERSMYSGVVGYMCVSGRADWSVTIRSAWRWDDEEDGVWHLGAGGAVTALSTPKGEREEMFAKLGGPLGALFGEFERAN